MLRDVLRADACGFAKMLPDIHLVTMLQGVSLHLSPCHCNAVNLLIAVSGKLYGRGSTDDKGPVAGWMNALEAFQKTNQVCHPP